MKLTITINTEGVAERAFGERGDFDYSLAYALDMAKENINPNTPHGVAVLKTPCGRPCGAVSWKPASE